jgi:hypothetical protein
VEYVFYQQNLAVGIDNYTNRPDGTFHLQLAPHGVCAVHHPGGTAQETSD